MIQQTCKFCFTDVRKIIGVLGSLNSSRFSLSIFKKGLIMIEGMHFHYDLSLSTLPNSISHWFSLKKKALHTRSRSAVI